MPESRFLARVNSRVRSVLVRAALNLYTPLSYLGSWTTGWWWPHETGTGTWQTNTATADPSSTLLTFPAVFACVTGIAQDVAKLRIKLTRQTNDDIWEEVHEEHGNSEEKQFKKVLNKPNHFQTRIQFVEQWIVSKLLNGNAYILKQRDSAGRVIRLYVLDPSRVTPLITDSGDVYYQLGSDNLAPIDEAAHIVNAQDNSGRFTSVTVPASEIIHDTMVSFWHPLIGVSPLTACALSATLGNKIGNHSTIFFQNRAMPGGVITGPREIAPDTAARIKAAWDTNFSGLNAGKVAVLGNDLKFEAMIMTAENAQLAEQLAMTREDVAMVFHYPLYKLQIGTPPYANGPQSAQLLYYTDCLQPLMEKLELHLDEGLSFPANLWPELDTDGLLRMDTLSMYDSINKASDWMKVDEQRKRANLPPLPIGGNTVYKQHQDYSIEALAKRDQGPDPFGNAPAPTPTPPEPNMPPPQKALREPATRELFVAELRQRLLAA